MAETEIVYGITNSGLILMPEQRAAELAQVYDALMTALTWGEFKELLPDERYYQKYLLFSEQYSGPRNVFGEALRPHYLPDEAPFRPGDVFNVEDHACKPGFPEIEMSGWVPAEIQQQYGQTYRYHAMDANVPAGLVLELDENRVDEIIQALEEKGYHCRQDDDLIDAACGSDFDPSVDWDNEDQEGE